MTTTKVILPIIRRTMPNIIAEEILRVQPMFSPYSKEEWPYQADMVMKYSQLSEIEQWCKETLNEGDWTNTAQYFAFNSEEVYAWFKLRWL